MLQWWKKIKKNFKILTSSRGCKEKQQAKSATPKHIFSIFRVSWQHYQNILPASSTECVGHLPSIFFFFSFICIFKISTKCAFKSVTLLATCFPQIWWWCPWWHAGFCSQNLAQFEFNTYKQCMNRKKKSRSIDINFRPAYNWNSEAWNHMKWLSKPMWHHRGN